MCASFPYRRSCSGACTERNRHVYRTEDRPHNEKILSYLSLKINTFLFGSFAVLSSPENCKIPDEHTLNHLFPRCSLNLRQPEFRFVGSTGKKRALADKPSDIDKFSEFRKNADTVRIMCCKLRYSMGREAVSFNKGRSIRRDGDIPCDKAHFRIFFCCLQAHILRFFPERDLKSDDACIGDGMFQGESFFFMRYHITML